MDSKMRTRRVMMAAAVALLTLGGAIGVGHAGGPTINADVTSWAVIYFAVGDPSPFFDDGTYVVMPTGQVYFHQVNWIYLGLYGAVVFPDGFPTVALVAGYHVAVVPVDHMLQVRVEPEPSIGDDNRETPPKKVRVRPTVAGRRERIWDATWGAPATQREGSRR